MSDLLANLSWFQETRGGQRGRKFNGRNSWNTNARTFVTSMYSSWKRRAGSVVRGKANGGTKGERKVREETLRAKYRVDSSYTSTSFTQCVGTLYFAYDIWYVIWYFGECPPILAIASVYTSLSFFFYLLRITHADNIISVIIRATSTMTHIFVHILLDI